MRRYQAHLFESRARNRRSSSACARITAVTNELRAWLEADPAATGRQLLERPQEMHLGRYPSGSLESSAGRTTASKPSIPLPKMTILGMVKASSNVASFKPWRCNHVLNAWKLLGRTRS